MDVFQVGLFFVGFLLIFFPVFFLFYFIYWGLKDAKYWLRWPFGLISSGVLHQERGGRIKEA